MSSTKVWALTASFRGCCSGCEDDGYCGDYDEGTPVLSLHATRELAEAALEKTKHPTYGYSLCYIEEMDVHTEINEPSAGLR